MEKQNILAIQDDDEEFEGKNGQRILFGHMSRNENQVAVNSKINELSKSDGRIKDVSIINLERILKSGEKFINIAKLNRAKISKEKSNNNTDMTVVLPKDKGFQQYYGNQSSKTTLTNIGLNYSHCELQLKNLLSEKLNSSSNSISVCNFVQNTYSKFNHPKKIRDFVKFLENVKGVIETGAIVKESCGIYKKYKNFSSGKHTTVCRKIFEMDVKMFLKLLFENIFRVEIRSSNKRRFSNVEDVYENDKKLSNQCCSLNSNHVSLVSDKITDAESEPNSTCMHETYNWKEDVPQKQDIKKGSDGNCETRISLLTNKNLSVNDQIMLKLPDPCTSQSDLQNPKCMCFQDSFENLVNNFESQTPFLLSKKHLIECRIAPDLVYPCYSQIENNKIIEKCPQDLMKETAINFETNTSSLNSKKFWMPLASIDPCQDQIKLQNTQGICFQDFIETSSGNFDPPTLLVAGKKHLIDNYILLNPCYPWHLNRDNCQKVEVISLQDFIKESAYKLKRKLPSFIDEKNSTDNCMSFDYDDVFCDQTKYHNIENVCLEDCTKEPTDNAEVDISLVNQQRLNYAAWEKYLQQIQNNSLNEAEDKFFIILPKKLSIAYHIPPNFANSCNRETKYEYNEDTNFQKTRDLDYKNEENYNVESRTHPNITLFGSPVIVPLKCTASNSLISSENSEGKSSNVAASIHNYGSSETAPCHLKHVYENDPKDLGENATFSPNTKQHHKEQYEAEDKFFIVLPKKISIAYHIPPNFANSCNRQTKYEYNEVTNFQETRDLDHKNEENYNVESRTHPNTTLFGSPVIVPLKCTVSNSLSSSENSEGKCSNVAASIHNNGSTKTAPCHLKHVYENDLKDLGENATLSPNTKQHIKEQYKKYYKHLIDQHFYELGKEKKIAESKMRRLRPHERKQYCGQVKNIVPKCNENISKNVQCPLEYVSKNDPKKSKVTSISTSSGERFPHFSKQYYKLYYKYLINEDFYKLRKFIKETRTMNLKTTIPKFEHQKQYFNGIHESINSNSNKSNENFTKYYPVSQKTNTSGVNLRKCGTLDKMTKTWLNFSKNCIDDTLTRNSRIDTSDVKPDSFNAQIKLVNELPKVSGKDLLSTFTVTEEDIKDTNDTISTTNAEAEMHDFYANNSSEKEKEVDIATTVTPCTSNSKVINRRKEFISFIAESREKQKRKRKLFADLKTDDVKRVSAIISPRYKTEVLFCTFNDTNNHNEATLNGKANNYPKQRLFSDPKPDNVIRVCHILEPRFKF